MAPSLQLDLHIDPILLRVISLCILLRAAVSCLPISKKTHSAVAVECGVKHMAIAIWLSVWYLLSAFSMGIRISASVYLNTLLYLYMHTNIELSIRVDWYNRNNPSLLVYYYIRYTGIHTLYWCTHIHYTGVHTLYWCTYTKNLGWWHFLHESNLL